MADHSFETESSRMNIPERRRHTTPARSEHISTSFSSSSSYIFSQYRTPWRRRNPTPATPFATDDDRSWQGELSWQFEPTGWQDNRNLGAVLSPWTANSATTPSSVRSRIFRRSANDYYLSHTYGGLQSFTNPYYENSHSGYDAVPSGRLELQSYVARANNGFSDRSYTSGEHTRPGRSPILSTIKEGSAGNSGALADKDELSTTDYGAPQDIDRQIRLIETYRDCKQHQDPRWFSVSHAYMDEKINIDHGKISSYHDVSHNNRGHDNLHHRLSHGHEGHYDHQLGHNAHDDLECADNSHHYHSHHDHSARQPPSHLNRVGNGYGDFDLKPAFVEEDDEEDEAVAPKSVGLFSLFRYSTKLDLVLMLFGCLGALINGGSLPWYSFLFGDFVNKLARGQDNDKHQMMKDVNKVCISRVQIIGRRC
ncbi:hypothetical protein Pfo_012320 [Paulownia fortunei]|nr:hypothetical protein Pfo_012320 [Paulownia fortunei]